MKKMLVSATALGLMCSAAFSQNGGPAPQSDNNQMNKPGNTTGTMNNSATTPGTTSGTTGMSTGIGSDGANRAGMTKDGTNRKVSRDKRGEMPK